MRIEKVTDTDYKISLIFNIDSSSMKEKIEQIILKLKKTLKLNGFYKIFMRAYSFGVFLIICRVDSSYYGDTLNIKFIDDKKINVYYRTKDYFLIKDREDLLYYNGYYYLLVDDSIIDNIIGIVDFGDFVFGKDIDKILTNAIVV